MPEFKNGTRINKDSRKYKRIRVSAGPHRGQYVDTLILEAKLGRKLGPGMTVEHVNGKSLEFGECGSNLIEVTREQNTALMRRRIYNEKRASRFDREAD